MVVRLSLKKTSHGVADDFSNPTLRHGAADGRYLA